MVAQFLGLKLRLLAGSFRRTPWQIVGMVFAVFYGLLVTAVIIAALFGARLIADTATVRDVLVVVGSCVVLGFLLLPLLFGVDDTLDPRAFSLYGIRNTRLAAGLAAAAFVSVPALALALCSFATIATWSRGPGAALFAVLCAIIAVPTCVLASRVTTSVAAFLLATRRSRELSGVLAVVAVLLLSLLGVVLLNIDWSHRAFSVLSSVESWVSWTPFGAVWSVPGDVALGEWGPALVKFLISLAFLGCLWLVWVALVAKMLVSPERTGRAKDYAGLGWFGRFRHGQARAVAARTVTYWTRDPRYWVSLVVIPLFPALMVIALLVAGVPGHYVSLIPLPIMCLFLGWTIHNDVAYDGTAVWLHVVSGIRGSADRAGRIFPVLLIGIPLVAVGSLVTTYFYGDWSVVGAVIGLSLAVLLIGIGLSSISSALFPYPATKPGENAFSHPQSAGGTAALIQSFSFVAIVVLASPVILFFVLGLAASSLWLIAVPVLGVVLGVVVLVLGIVLGGRIFDARQPELMAFAMNNG